MVCPHFYHVFFFFVFNFIRALAPWGGLGNKADRRREGKRERGILTWYLWNLNLFTAAAISSITEWLNFYYIIFIKRQRKLHPMFCLFPMTDAALPAPSVQDLPIWKEQVSPAVLTKGPPQDAAFICFHLRHQWHVDVEFVRLPTCIWKAHL